MRLRRLPPAVVAGLVAGMCLVAAACGSNGTDAESSTRPGTERDLRSDPTSVPDESGDPWLSVAESSLGSILVDAEGFTLYALIGSNGDPGACTGPCADIWPPMPFQAAGPIGPGVDPSQVGQTTRDDGTTQVVYGGQPLYRYRDDADPGDMNGQGVNDVWYVIAPNGEVIGAVADTSTSDAPPDDAPTTDGTDPFSY